MPSNPIETDVIDGATDGPRGRCHKAIVVVVELHAARVRMVCIFELLLIQVLISNIVDSGVPDGADPF